MTGFEGWELYNEARQSTRLSTILDYLLARDMRRIAKATDKTSAKNSPIFDIPSPNDAILSDNMGDTRPRDPNLYAISQCNALVEMMRTWPPVRTSIGA